MPREKEKGANTSPEMDLERLFRELDGVGSVAVSRNEPDWAKGHIRTVQISAGTPISMDWLKKQFGGSKLRVRVYGADSSQLIGSRTVEIMGPPKDGYGVEVVRGPDGNGVLIHRLAEEQRRYNQLHGIEAPQPSAAQFPEQSPAAAPAQPFDMTQMFTTMIAQMNQANQTMMNMLVTRIGQLESVGPAAPVPAAVAQVEPVDPLGNLKNTVDVIAQLDAVKEKMGLSDRPQQPEGGGYLDLIKGFMEIHLETQKAKAAQLQAAPQHAQLPPGYPPPPGVPVPTQGQQMAGAVPPGVPGQPPGAPLPPPEQLLPLVQQVLPQYLEGASRQERLQLAELVLGEQIEDGDFDLEEEIAAAEPPAVAVPPPSETDFPNRQGVENELDLETYGETGGLEDDPNCDPPPPLVDTEPATRPE